MPQYANWDLKNLNLAVPCSAMYQERLLVEFFDEQLRIPKRNTMRSR